MKSLRAFVIITLGVRCSAVSLSADEVITCKSPDGKFALRCVYADKQPYNGAATIVDLATHKNVFSIDPNWTLGNVKLLWSQDSHRVAYFSERGNNYTTRVFFRYDPSFREIALPVLPSPKLPPNAIATADTATWIEPMRWNAAGDLLLEKELLNPTWGRAALKITLGFDEVNRPFVRSAAQEKMSIVDYFLLLPAENFEAPLSAWLRQMRMGGYFQMCDGKWREKHIDEKNGYMSCDGDGAQPEFEVALFRHRDGRPLLALCSGELEGPDSVSLTFYELGQDKKMHEIQRSIFPVPDSDSDRWQFDLPKQGRTILVRARKSGEVLHKITWNGERFEKHK